MSVANSTVKEEQIKLLEDMTYRQKKVKMYVLSGKERVYRYRSEYMVLGERPEICFPEKTDHGHLYYIISIDGFMKYKSGEWDKYQLGTMCVLRIPRKTKSCGTETVTVYPVVEEIIDGRPVLTKFQRPNLVYPWETKVDLIKLINSEKKAGEKPDKEEDTGFYPSASPKQ